MSNAERVSTTPTTPHRPTPILNTKFYHPPLQTSFVVRPRLLARLGAGVNHPLVLIAAPVGFGKTTLFSQFISQQSEANPPIRVAWLSLDADDNDPLRFWAYVLMSVASLQPEACQRALSLIQSPQPPLLKDILSIWINDLSALGQPITLVCDDYHLITTPSIHASLTFLLDHIPPQLRLVILSRIDPPLPLARLRAHNQLLELRESDLRFTAAEATEFLNHTMRLNLSVTEALALTARTEGWVAGLQLAGLSLQGHGSPAHFAQAFTGSHRFVMDYLFEEVLQQQPSEIVHFLLRTSILERFTAPICDALSAVINSEPKIQAQPLLEYLERANLFLVPLDAQRQWYRFHYLFGDLLRHRLQQTREASFIASLHLSASEWFAQQSLWPEAITHALAASAFERVAQLLETYQRDNEGRPDTHASAAWLRALPSETLHAHPRLCIWYAMQLIETRQFDRAEQMLNLAETALPGLMPAAEADQQRGLLALARGDSARLRGDTTRSIEWHRQALSLLPNNAQRLRALSRLGLTHFDHGDLKLARAELSEALPQLWAHDYLGMALGGLHALARLQIAQGELHAAVETCKQALAEMERRDMRTLSTTGWPLLGLGQVYLEWNELAMAEQFFTEAITLGQRGDQRGIGVVAQMFLAQLKQAQGDSSGAQAAIYTAEQLVSESLSPRDRARVAQAQALLWIAQGKLAEAEQWATTNQLRASDALSFERERVYLTFARLRLAQGQTSVALTTLERLRRLAETQGRTGDLVRILALRAATLHRQAEHAQANAALSTALALGAAEGFVRSFLDAGAPVMVLLEKMKIEDSALRTYADKLRTALSNPQSSVANQSALLDPLSERELEILRLIASGLTNAEIAGRLVVSPSTIKTHINNLYSKLHVRTRTQALLRARELHLL